MNKAKIEAIARQKRATSSKQQTSTIAPDERKATKERETRGAVNLTPEAVNLTPETIDAIVEGFSIELRRVILEVGPIIARISAADTIHTVEWPAKVFGRAITEAQTASCVLHKAGILKE